MIPRFKPYLGWGEFKEIFRHQSDSVRRFEEEFARTFEARHALAFPYGRSALWAFFNAFDLKGVEVILPAYTCVVVAHAIVLSGNIPRFVDVVPDDFNMDLGQVEEAMNDRTGAVIATHLFGYPLDVERLNQIVRGAEKKYGKKIWIIQDCAHGFGIRWKGELVCNERDLSLFGLNISKMITSIFGGMITTQDGELAQKLYQWRRKHFSKGTWLKSLRRRAYLLAIYPGFNERLYKFINSVEESTGLLDYFTKAYHRDDEIHFPPDFSQNISSVEAQVGIQQLHKYGEIIHRRKEGALFYNRHLREFEKWRLPSWIEGATFSHYVVRVPDKEKVCAMMLKRGIQLGQLIEYSIPHMETYRKYTRPGEKLQNSLRRSQESINLPIYPQLDLKRYQDILREIQKVYRQMN